MVLDPIPQPLPVHFLGLDPSPPPLIEREYLQAYNNSSRLVIKHIIAREREREQERGRGREREEEGEIDRARARERESERERERGYLRANNDSRRLVVKHIIALDFAEPPFKNIQPVSSIYVIHILESISYIHLFLSLYVRVYV